MPNLNLPEGEKHNLSTFMTKNDFLITHGQEMIAKNAETIAEALTQLIIDNDIEPGQWYNLSVNFCGKEGPELLIDKLEITNIKK